jgi:hypothetical protein
MEESAIYEKVTKAMADKLIMMVSTGGSPGCGGKTDRAVNNGGFACNHAF